MIGAPAPLGGSNRMPPSEAIGRLEEELQGDRSAVDAFLGRHDFPIAEPPLYTVVYRGEAQAVSLRHWIYGLPTSQPFARLVGSDLWYRTVELPAGSRVEYKIEVVREGQARWIEDPLNPQLARDPFGANSVVAADGYVIPDWARPDPAVREGRLEPRVQESAALGGRRRVTLYFPPRYRPSRRYPLLVVHDGPDYLEYAGLKTVLDNLIHRLEIPGIIVALLHTEERMVEYGCHPAHARFLNEELVPALEEELPLLGTVEGRGLMGASLGAVAAFHAAARDPEMYGNLLLQSGSFAFTDIGDNPRGPAFDPIVEFMNRYRASPVPLSRRVFLSVGRYEPMVYENRSLVPVLQSTGMAIRYVEARDGHNWENWRDRRREGLSWLFPGPLWMVYE